MDLWNVPEVSAKAERASAPAKRAKSKVTQRARRRRHRKRGEVIRETVWGGNKGKPIGQGYWEMEDAGYGTGWSEEKGLESRSGVPIWASRPYLGLRVCREGAAKY